MVLEQIRLKDGLTFDLTCTERERIEGAKFMQKPDIILAVDGMRLEKGVLRLKNIIFVDGHCMKQELDYIFPNDKERFAEEMMDISMSYAILWVGSDSLGFNEIIVAKTAHNTTNIDADVIEAFLGNLKEIAENGMD